MEVVLANKHEKVIHDLCKEAKKKRQTPHVSLVSRRKKSMHGLHVARLKGTRRMSRGARP
jgi:hypothetical protein